MPTDKVVEADVAVQHQAEVESHRGLDQLKSFGVIAEEQDSYPQ